MQNQEDALYISEIEGIDKLASLYMFSHAISLLSFIKPWFELTRVFACIKKW